MEVKRDRLACAGVHSPVNTSEGDERSGGAYVRNTCIRGAAVCRARYVVTQQDIGYSVIIVNLHTSLKPVTT